MTATSGPMSRTPFAFYDPDSSCWRTSQGTLALDSTQSSVTLPRWGSMRSGALYERPTPARLTGELGCSSLLPTPNAAKAGSDTTLTCSGDGREKPNKLGWAVTLLSTPQARDYKGLPSDGFDHANLVRDVLALLPTPTPNMLRNEEESVEDWQARRERVKESAGNGNGFGMPLTKAVQLLSGDLMLPSAVMHLLPTPATSNGKSTRAMTSSTDNGRRSGGGQSSGPGLEEITAVMAGHWPENLPPPERMTETARKSLGVSTPPRSNGGAESSDDPHPGQLSLDATDGSD